MTSASAHPRNRAGLSRTLRNTVRATYGTPPFLVQHGWRQRYVDRHDEYVDRFSEDMPPVQPSTSGSTTQTRDQGLGPIVMRSFTVEIAGPEMSPADLMTAFRRRPNDFVPRHIAGFVRGDDDVDSMAPSDEFVVEIPGPWNGPVRVDAVDDTSVLLVTLDGHMEAGHIRFAVLEANDGGYRFEIRSWARAGDELFKQLHLVAGVAHEAQTAMWVHTCDRAVAVSGGTRRSDISGANRTPFRLGSRRHVSERPRKVIFMKSLVAAGPADRFRIYLNDHRGLLAAEQALANRSLSSNDGTELGHVLQTIVDQNAADQTAIDRLLERTDGAQNPLKRIGAIIGERFGRLKMNGQLTGYSPLSRVIEIEALLASTAMRRAMWNAVAAMEIDDDVTTDAAIRAENAGEQHERLNDRHVEAVMVAFEVRS